MYGQGLKAVAFAPTVEGREKAFLAVIGTARRQCASLLMPAAADTFRGRREQALYAGEVCAAAVQTMDKLTAYINIENTDPALLRRLTTRTVDECQGIRDEDFLFNGLSPVRAIRIRQMAEQAYQVLN